MRVELTPRQRRVMTRTRTTMVPSSTSLQSTASASAAADGGPLESQSSVASSTLFQKHPQEPNLYMIPPGLHATYQPVPVLLRLVVWVAAVISSTALSFRPILTIVHKDAWSVRTTIGLIVKALLFSALSKVLLQEILVPPSRISINDLMQNYVLPSTLSKFDKLEIKGNEQPQGVHYLQYDSTITKTKPQFQAIYFNHGFGANSLSWLPVLPRLVDRVKARRGVGHDAVGFGFTERPSVRSNKSALFSYTPKGSSEIGNALLAKVTSKDSDDDNDKPVILMGHSMGCLATLHMAATLPKTTKKWVILVAPALGINPSKGGKSEESPKKGLIPKRIKQAWIRLGSLVGRYMLRRVVGGRNFWRRGLEQVWFDKKKLTDSDVLRFQWPAVGRGWEDGILTFTRAMAQPPPMTDNQLLKQVVTPEANAIVTVIVSRTDKVIPSKRMQKFLSPFEGKLQIVEMADVGHDPFEEDVEGFVSVVEELLEKSQEQILGSVS